MDDERNIYLNAMRNQKRGLVFRDGVLVNPSVQNDIGSLSAMDTSFSTEAEGTQEEAQQNWWQKGVNAVISTAEEFSDNIQRGIYSFLDGIGDFFINGIGWIVDSMGGDDTAFRNAANYDWQSHAINFANATSYDFTKNLLSGEAGKITQNFANSFNQEKAQQQLQSNTDTSLTHYWGEDAQNTYANITQGIGSVLPSVVLGIVTGGAGFAAQAINLGALGISAAGNTQTEAMNEGASYGQAFLSGAISAGIEVGTELASAGIGKVAGKVTGKAVTFGQNIAGSGITKIGKRIATSTTSKAVLEIAQNMVEEGMEEFASELLSPLSKQVYKGKEAWEGYKSGEIWKDAGISFVGGAIGGLVGDGVGAVYMRAALGGKQGVELSKKVNEMRELKKQQLEKAKNLQEYGAETQQLEKLANEYSVELQEFAEKDPNGFKKYCEAMTNIKGAVEEAREKAEKDGTLNEFNEDLAKMEATTQQFIEENAYITADPKDIFSQETAEKASNLLGKEVNISRTKLDKGIYGRNENEEGKSTISINKKLGDKNFAKTLPHEFVETVFAFNDDTRAKFLNDLKQKNLNLDFNAYEKEVVNNYFEDLDIVKNEKGNIDYDKTIEKNKNNKTFQKEVLSLAFENVFNNYAKLGTILNTAQRSRMKSLLQKVKNKFSNKREAKVANLLSKYIKALDTKTTTTEAKTKQKVAVGYKKDKKKLSYTEKREIESNLLSRYNNYLSNNKEITGGVLVSGDKIVLFDNNNFNLNIKDFIEIEDGDSSISDYLKSLYEKGESYSVSEFNRLLRQGFREIRKYQRGDKRNDVSSFTYNGQKRANSIEQDDGQRVDRSSKIEKGYKKVAKSKEIKVADDSELKQTFQITNKGGKYNVEIRKETEKRKVNQYDDDGKVIKDKKGKPVQVEKDVKVTNAYIYDKDGKIVKKVDYKANGEDVRNFIKDWDDIVTTYGDYEHHMRSAPKTETTEAKVEEPKKPKTASDILKNHKNPTLHANTEFIANPNSKDQITFKVEKRKDGWVAFNTKTNAVLAKAKTFGELKTKFFANYPSIWTKAQVDKASKRIEKLVERQNELAKKKAETAKEEKVEPKPIKYEQRTGLVSPKNESYQGEYIAEVDGKRFTLEVYKKFKNKKVQNGNQKTIERQHIASYVYLVDKNGVRFRKIKFVDNGGEYDFAKAIRYQNIYRPANEKLGTKEEVLLKNNTVQERAADSKLARNYKEEGAEKKYKPKYEWIKQEKPNENKKPKTQTEAKNEKGKVESKGKTENKQAKASNEEVVEAEKVGATLKNGRTYTLSKNRTLTTTKIDGGKWQFVINYENGSQTTELYEDWRKAGDRLKKLVSAKKLKDNTDTQTKLSHKGVKLTRNGTYDLADGSKLVVSYNDGKYTFERISSKGKTINKRTFSKDATAEKAFSQYGLKEGKPIVPEQTKVKSDKTENVVKEKEAKKVSFVSRENTAKIIDDTINNLKAQNKNIVFKFPKGKEQFVGVSFSTVNSRAQAEYQAKLLSNRLMEVEISSKDKASGQYIVLGNLGQFLNDSQKETLGKDLVKMLENAQKTDSVDTEEQKTINMVSQRLNAQIKSIKPLIRAVKGLKTLRYRITRGINKAQFGIESVNKYGMEILMKPFAVLTSSDYGYYNNEEFVSALNETIAFYTEEKVNQMPGMVYDPTLRAMFDEIYETIGAPEITKNGLQRGSSFSADDIKLIKETMRAVNTAVNNIRNKKVKDVAPAVKQSTPYIKGAANNSLLKTVKSIANVFLPAYIVNRMTFGGNTYLAELVSTKAQNQYSKEQLLKGKVAEKLTEIQKNLNLDKKLGEEITFKGEKLEYDTLAYIWAALNTEANKEAIDNSGLKVYKDGKLIELAKNGEADAMLADLESLLPDNVKQYAKQVQKIYNDGESEFGIKKLYVEGFEQRYGKGNGLTLLDNYLPITRESLYNFDKTHQLANVDSVFKAFHERSKHANSPIIATGMTSLLTTYTEQLGRELYMHPIYQEYIMSMNYNLGTEAHPKTLRAYMQELGLVKELNYLQQTMEMFMGKNEKANYGFWSKLTSRYALSKLALNIGTWLKQYTSIWTSNIKLSASIKALQHTFEKDTEFKSLYNEIAGRIGQVLYREANKTASEGQLNIDSSAMGKIFNAVERYGMIGTIKIDKAAIVTGVWSLMEIAKKEYNTNWVDGKKEIKEFVEANISEFIMSQIGTNANSRNAITRGEYGDAIRGVFGFMQGAFNAALGSQVNKVATWYRNRKVNKTVLIENLKEAKNNYSVAEKELEKAQEALEKAIDSEDEAKIEEAENIVSIKENDLIEAKTAFEDARLKKADYDKFIIMGGNRIIPNMVAGLGMQALVVVLINALIKRLTGKKDWDDWNAKDMAIEFAYAWSVDWIPGVNQITNVLLKGYDFSNPQVSLLNDIAGVADIFKNMFNGTASLGSSISKLATAIAGMTGMPVQRIIDYFVGISNIFNPEVALATKNFFYATSLQSASRTMNDYISRGKDRGGKAMFGYIMDNYKISGTSDKIKNEIYALLKEGYQVMPSSVPTEYTDENGTKQVLNAQQEKQFKQLYSAVNQKVGKLIDNASYKTATSEERAKMLKKLYDTYYGYARCKVVGAYSSSTKLSRLLYLTNGKTDVAEYILYLQKIGSITETKRLTRKQAVFKYVNRLPMDRRKKLLLLYLAGYNGKDVSTTQLQSYLRLMGMTYKQAQSFLNGSEE